MNTLLRILTVLSLFSSTTLFAQSSTDKQEQKAYEAGIFEARATETLQIKLKTDYLTPCETHAYTKYGVRPVLLGTSLSVYDAIKTNAFNEVMYQRIKDSLNVSQDLIGKPDSNQIVFNKDDYENFFKAIVQEKIADSLVKLQLPEESLEKLGYTYLDGLIIRHLETNTNYSLSDIKQGIRLPYVKNTPLTFVTDPRNISNQQLCIDMIFYPYTIKE